MSDLKKVLDALDNAFGSPLVQSLSKDEFADFVEQSAILAINTMVKNEGVGFTKGFCDSAINDKSNAKPVINHIKSEAH